MPIDWTALLNTIPALVSLAVAVGVLVSQRRTSKDREVASAVVLVEINNKLDNNVQATKRLETSVGEVRSEIRELKTSVNTTQVQQTALCQYHRMNHPGQDI